MLWFSKAEEFDKAKQHHLDDCIECGACAYVCPSNIPLVQYYRYAKGAIAELKAEAEKAERARERFEQRKQRIEQEEAEKEARRMPKQKKRLHELRLKQLKTHQLLPLLTVKP